MPENAAADAVIIGAGILGVAIAFELCKRGYRTLNVDRSSASGYDAARNAYPSVHRGDVSIDELAVAREAIACWRGWSRYVGVSDELGMARYVDSGVLLIKGADLRHERVARHYRAVGVPYEEWTTSELAARLPMYHTGSFSGPRRPGGDASERGPATAVAGAIFTPEGGYVVDPVLAAHNLRCAVRAHGGTFRFTSDVVAVRRDDDRVRGVKLDDGTDVDAPVVVNVAGPCSARVNRLADVDRTMRTGTRTLRREVHQVPAPPDVDFESVGIPTSDGDQSISFRPEKGNNIVVGSEDDLVGPKEWVEDPDDYDRGVSQAAWDAQVGRLALRIPALEIPRERVGVASLLDVTDDDVPIYDMSSLPGFYMAIGAGGERPEDAPVVGHLMAELITAVQAGHDHDRRPMTLIGPRTGVALNVGAYSRLRDASSRSSQQVRA